MIKTKCSTYVDEGRLANAYGYQGDYLEFDSRTGWNRFALRGNYDSRLERWMSMDLMSRNSASVSGVNPLLAASVMTGGKVATDLLCGVPIVSAASSGEFAFSLIGGHFAAKNGGQFRRNFHKITNPILSKLS